MKNTWKKIMLAATLAPIAYRLYEWYRDIPAPEHNRKKSHAA